MKDSTTVYDPEGAHREICFHCELFKLLNEFRRRNPDYPDDLYVSDVVDACADLLASGCENEGNLAELIAVVALRLRRVTTRVYRNFKTAGLKP